MKEISKNWEHYLARPFSLFVSSLWHEWYNSEKTRELYGGKIEEGLYIENPKGVTRSYRIKGEIQKFNDLIEDIAINNPEKTKKFLKEALELNKKAQNHINKKDIKNLKESVDFLIDLALLATIFPYFAVEGLEKKGMNKTDIMEMCKKLREVSYYPNFLKEIVMPLVKSELIKNKITLDGAEKLITYKEIVNKKLDIDIINHRLKMDNGGKFFVYYAGGSRENIGFVDNSSKLINEIEPQQDKNKTIKGMVAYKGIVRGMARLIFSNDVSKITFNEGDIIVASSTNPALVPLMKKAAAFVTDEGGVMCHAAILGREMKKPCIVGTKFATKVLRDGDMIEVDANKGFIKIINKGY